MEALRLRAQIDKSNRRKVILAHRLQAHKIDSITNYLLGLVLAQVAVCVPDHATLDKPLGLHRLELCIGERLEDLHEVLLLIVIFVQKGVELAEGQTEDLVEVVVFPVLSRGLLNLVEDIFTVSILEVRDLLESLSNKVGK